MNPRRRQLDYASAGSAAPSHGRWVIAAGCCFGVSWLVWLVVAIATLDSFDDKWVEWMFLLIGVGGTASGIVLFAVVSVVMNLSGGD